MAQTEPVIADYDNRSAEEIKQRLRTLSQADLVELEAYEKQGQARSTVLEAIAALRTDPPWSGYDDMEVDEVKDALKHGDSDLAGRVLDYERQHKGRTTILEFAKRNQEASDGSSAAMPDEGGKAKAKTGSQASGASSRSKREANRRASSSSRGGSKRSSSRSTRGRSAKAAVSRTRATPPNRTRASGSQLTKRSQGTRPRAQSNSASQSQMEAREEALAKIRQRATQALRTGEGRTISLAGGAKRAVGSTAKDTRRAAGSKAEQSRHAVGSAVKDTGQAVQTAAGKSRAPALVGAATIAALGGGIALRRGSKAKLRKRKRVLGVPVPKRTTLRKAAKQMSKAVDSAGSTGKRVADWSDGLKEFRHKMADGKSPASKLSGG